MWRDFLRTYRGLLRRPTFFVAVVLTMALGIGANSAIFSVIDAVLLKPLPYPGGDRLVAVYESSPQQHLLRINVAPGRLEEWNRMNQTFTSIAGAYTENQAETSGQLPEKLVCAKTSPRFFSVLGTPPILGHTFSPEDVGLIMAYGAFQWLVAAAPANVPRLDQVGLNWRGRRGSATLARDRDPVRTRSGVARGAHRRPGHVDPGFRPEHLMTMRISPAAFKYRGHPELQIQLVRNILRSVSTLPGVWSAAMTTDVPLLGGPSSS